MWLDVIGQQRHRKESDRAISSFALISGREFGKAGGDNRYREDLRNGRRRTRRGNAEHSGQWRRATLHRLWTRRVGRVRARSAR